MREIKNYCDICKKEVKTTLYFLQGGKENIIFDDLNLELCVKCINKLKRWIRNEINT